MEWADEGIILHIKPLGERKVILDVLTKGHGRHMGVASVAKKGPSRGTIQPGNQVYVRWKARISEQLGQFIVELTQASGALIMMQPLGMNVFQLTSVALRLFLPERAAYPHLYDAFLELLRACMFGVKPLDYARFEMYFLGALGFGLDLQKCVVTGSRDNLCYVSPKSGCAVSDEAAGPYVEKLLRLPRFLVYTANVLPSDIKDSCQLSGYFLEKNLNDLPRFALWKDLRDDVMQDLFK